MTIQFHGGDRSPRSKDAHLPAHRDVDGDPSRENGTDPNHPGASVRSGTLIGAGGIIAALGLLWFNVGFVRHQSTLPRNLPNHPVRRQIIDVLKSSPGASISGLCEVLGFKWGTMQHHLYLLERAGILQSVTRGREHRFFLKGEDRAFALRVAALRRGRVLDLVRQIIVQPGAIQREIATRVHMSRKVLREYVTLLKDEGLLHEARIGATRRYYPTDLLESVLRDPRLGKRSFSGRVEDEEASRPGPEGSARLDP